MDYVYSNGRSRHFEFDPVNHRQSSSSSSSSSPSSSSSVDSYVANPPLETKLGPPSSPEAFPPSANWSIQSGSSSQSPQIPRPAGYDPSRIPSSVFASKPSSAMDWSVASNESLFSLHVGNNSFSRDFLMLNKSGELTRPEELFFIPTSLPPLPRVTETEIFETRSPKVEIKMVPNESENVEKKSVERMSLKVVEIDSVETEALPAETKDKLPVSEEFQNFATSCRSDSNNSACSFQFPLLSGDDAERTSTRKMDLVKHQPELSIQQQRMIRQAESQSGPKTPLTKNTATSWYSCFVCCAGCC